MAEGQGFEPWVPCGTTDFESVTFDLSDTPPVKQTARSLRPCNAIQQAVAKLNPDLFLNVAFSAIL